MSDPVTASCKDPPPQPRALGDRERFVAFAFAASDLLVEVCAGGSITFATGAFRARLGRAPDELLGAPATELVAPEDRVAFAAALTRLPLRGRMPPTTFRLSDPGRTTMAVAGLSLPAPGASGLACLSFAPMPTAPEAQPPDRAILLREAEARLRQGGPAGQLGLIEVLGQVERDPLGSISAALGGRIGAVAAQVAPGRFGLLSPPGADLPDLAAIATGLEAELGESVATQTLSLAADGLTPMQASRALRHALSVFSRQGAARLRQSGADHGLTGVVAQVASRASALRQAITQRRFRLDYQPICSLADGRIHHYEALLRPERGLPGADGGVQEFVLLAETVGLISELDLAVLDRATAATAALAPGERIAVNVSGLSVQDPAIRQALLAMLDRRPEAVGHLMIELTESAEIEDEQQAHGTLAALRARGVPVCLDDFGAGAAAFRYLKAFPVDYVKVDGAYVQSALTQERDRAFVAAMVDLSLAVGARVIAERIETEEEAQMMRRLGVHLGQGWLFGKPGPLTARRARNRWAESGVALA